MKTMSLASASKTVVVRLADYLTKVENPHGSENASDWFATGQWPSGHQRAATRLEADLLEQLAFADCVHDVMTNVPVDAVVGADSPGSAPIATASMVLQLDPRHGTGPSRFVIKVIHAENPSIDFDRQSAEVNALKVFARRHRVAFRCLREKDIRTPYLDNARLCGPLVGAWPQNDVLGAIRDVTDRQCTTFGGLVRHLVSLGYGATRAREQVAIAITGRWIACDLSLPMDDDTILSKMSIAKALDPLTDPLLHLISHAPTK